jgi:hypothetical protein
MILKTLYLNVEPENIESALIFDDSKTIGLHCMAEDSPRAVSYLERALDLARTLKNVDFGDLQTICIALYEE